jgi:hypothetical protein
VLPISDCAATTKSLPSLLKLPRRERDRERLKEREKTHTWPRREALKATSGLLGGLSPPPMVAGVAARHPQTPLDLSRVAHEPPVGLVVARRLPLGHEGG